jgi:hypothetical protein
MRRYTNKYELSEGEISAFFRNANYNNMWIRIGKEWYTPPEFMAKFKHGDELPEKPVISNPFAAIREGREKINDLTERLDAFIERVLEYYQTPKP